jgi:hypothetical protein
VLHDLAEGAKLTKFHVFLLPLDKLLVGSQE